MRATFSNTIAAGETLEFAFDLTSCGYPATDGATLRVFLVGPALPDDSPLRDGIASGIDGDAFTGSIAADVTAALTPGEYTWTAQRVKDGAVRNVATGIVTVAPNPASAAAADGIYREVEEQQLANVQATLTRLYAKDTKQLSAFEFSLVRQEIKELEASRALLERRIAARRSGDQDAPQPQSGAFAFSRPE